MLFDNNLKQNLIQGLISSQCDIMKFKTVAIVMREEHSNQEKSIIFTESLQYSRLCVKFPAGTKL